MLFFSENDNNINLKGIRELVASRLAMRHQHGAVCTACQKPLTNEDSMIAGMGPVCLERARFAEAVSRDQLGEIEGQKEPINKGLYPARTAILREKSEKLPRYVTVLSVTPLESLLIDRTEMNKVYAQTGSMAEAIGQSLYSFVPVEGESIAPTTNPKHPEVMRSFKKFQKSLRDIIKERMDYLKGNPYSSYYNQVSSKKGLTAEQEAARIELLSQKDLKPEYFNEGWSKGLFHRATWLSRLNQTQLSEAKMLASVLKIKAFPESIKIQDYGLTDAEIMGGLGHSNQIQEKNLFKAFVEGNKNLMFLMEIYKKFDTVEGPDKLFFIRLSNTMTSKENLKLDQVQKLKELLPKYKISPNLISI